jgi:hypothetical protein
MPKGERVLAQSKRTAPPPPISKNVIFYLVLKEVFQLVSYFDIISNWYTLFKLISKTLLNTKRRISLRGSFV